MCRFLDGEGEALNVEETKLTMIITMLMGGFFGLLNETLLVTALPSIMKDFEISYTQVQWLTTVFFID